MRACLALVYRLPGDAISHLCFLATAWLVGSEFPDQGLNLGRSSESLGS